MNWMSECVTSIASPKEEQSIDMLMIALRCDIESDPVEVGDIYTRIDVIRAMTSDRT